MSLKTKIVSRVAQNLFGEDRLNASREKEERRRISAAEPHIVRYFHQVDDPYSHIALAGLQSLVERYDVTVEAHIVSPPPDWAAPDRERLVSHSAIDAARLGARAGLAPFNAARTPAGDDLLRAQGMLAQAIADDAFPQRAPAISAAVWQGADWPDYPDKDPAEEIARGNHVRDALKHYLGATFQYGGEWYWGLDRLHYLETRLSELGARKPGAEPAPFFAPPARRAATGRVPDGTVLNFYCSFRSPYTGIVVRRIKAIADDWGAQLQLNYVLPMVMRSMQVPKEKGRYIMADTAREARRMGVPFGRIADPVGKPVERGYAILEWAMQSGNGYAFAESFLGGVWSEGIDAGSDSGMRKLVERAGLDWTEARAQIATKAWENTAETNRQELLNLGLWGVPSFRVGDVSTWGQDRLWVIEDELARLAGAS